MTESVAFSDTAHSHEPILAETWGADDDEYVEEGAGIELGDIRIPPLAPVPTGLVRPGDSLCDICRQLQLNVDNFIVTPGDHDTYKAHLFLGLVEDMKKKTHCPLCRLILGSIGSELPSVEDGQPLSVSYRWEAVEEMRSISPYAWKPGGRYANPKRLNAFPRITLLANDTPTLSKLYSVRPIEDKIDFNMVSNWLFMCEDWHGDECEKSKFLDGIVDNPTLLIPSFRLIDVIDNCIVSAPRNVIYIALSYVWGRIDPAKILRLLKANVDELQTPGALLQQHHHDRIPLTIQHAMHVARELQLRYIWVDSLCIIQDDIGPGGSKMDAITKMDLIYGAAYLTIIAATGTDANAGLPGVYPGTRQVPQLIEEVLPGLRLASKPSGLSHITNIHRTRAWTYVYFRLSSTSFHFSFQLM